MKTRIGLMIVLLLGFFAPLVTSCAAVAPLEPIIADGMVIEMQPGSTIWGLNQALTNQTATSIWNKDTYYLFQWQIRDGVAWMIMDAKALTNALMKPLNPKGNFATVRTANDLFDFLKTNGWKTIDPTQVDPALKTGIVELTTWFLTLSKMWTTYAFFINIPGIWFEFTGEGEVDV